MGKQRVQNRIIILLSAAVITLSISPLSSIGQDTTPPETVTVVIPGNYPPLFQLDSKDRPSGLEWEILESIKEAAGIETKYVGAESWSAAVEMISSNKADILPGVAYDPTLLPDDFTIIHHITPITVYCFSNAGQGVYDPTELKDRNIRVGIINNTIPSNKLANLQIANIVESYDQLDIGINCLLSGEIDILLAAKIQLNWRLNDLGLSHRIVSSQQPLITIERGYLLNKTNQELAEKLERAIEELTQSGQYLTILDKWQSNNKFEYNTSHYTIFTQSIIIALGLLTIYLLRQKVRKKAEMLKEREEYLRNILESTECIFLTVTEDFTIKYVNNYAIKFFGYSREEMVGQNSLSLLVPDIDSEGNNARDTIKKLHNNSASKDQAMVNENITRDGRRIWIAWSSRQVKNEKTGEIEIFSFGIDITQQKVIEQELKSLQLEKEAILNNMAGGVLFLDTELNIKSVNKEIEHITGELAQDMIGKKCYEVVCHQEKVCNSCPANMAMETGQRSSNETYATINNHNFDIISSPLYNNNNKLTGTISIFTDVTRRKQLHDNLKSAHKAMEYYTRILEDRVRAGELKLEEKEGDLKAAQGQLLQAEKMASLGRLIAGIGHEINTPLGAIRSSGEIITHAIDHFQDNTEEFAQWLTSDDNELFYQLFKTAIDTNMMEISTKDLRERRNYISNYLNTLNIDNNALTQKLIDIGVFQDIENYKDFLHDVNINNKIEIIQDLSHIRNSAQIIEWAVDKTYNIIFALKNFIHTSTNTGKIKTNIKENINMILVIYGNQIKHGVEVELELDELPDIMSFPDELNQVWSNLISNALQAIEYHGKLTISGEVDNNFVKITVNDTGCGIAKEIQSMIFEPMFTTKAAGQGTGIGLDIVNTIVKKHNGTIKVESKVGEGSSFIIFLPIDNTDKNNNGDRNG